MSKWGKRSALSIVIGTFVAGAALIAGGLPAVASPGDQGDGASSAAAQAYYAEVAKAEAATGLTRAAKTAPELAAPDGASRFSAAATVVASDFAAGNLMTDAVFYNGTAFSEGQIQGLFDTQVPTCKTGYVCLRSYKAATAARSADAMCKGYTAASSELASVIITKVAASCGINPGVLVSLLQKEQGLVTDDWPSATQYAYATGYSCPDDPGIGCDPDTAGFFAQVYGAAWQFKRYANPAGTSNYFTWYPVGKVTNVLYSEKASLNCGSAPVAIWNKATAALYYYTPYQPNAAALANFFGTGDKCSSYGNRNFWGTYTSWFGSTIAGRTPSVSRASGADRYAVAVSISRAAYPAGSVPVVYVASGANFPDALSAAPAASLRGGPLLLVQPTGVPSNVLAEVKRLKPKKIIVVGGQGSVSTAVMQKLATVQPNIARRAGVDRYDASRTVVADAWAATGAKTVYIATGATFPDALSAGAAAGARSAPVLLVNGSRSSLDAPTLALLRSLGTTTVHIVGGKASVSAGIQAQLAKLMTVGRYDGADRFAVSANLNVNSFKGTAPAVYLANGFVFPDALAGAAAAGAAKSPLYVVKPTCVPSAAASGALGVKPAKLALLGGPASVSNEVSKLTVCR